MCKWFSRAHFPAPHAVFRSNMYVFLVTASFFHVIITPGISSAGRRVSLRSFACSSISAGGNVSLRHFLTTLVNGSHRDEIPEKPPIGSIFRADRLVFNTLTDEKYSTVLSYCCMFRRARSTSNSHKLVLNHTIHRKDKFCFC